MSLGVKNSKHLTLKPYFLARSMQYLRFSSFGFVLSITTLFPVFISYQAALQHFSFVFRESWFILTYFQRQLVVKVDLPDPGAPTFIIISFSTNYTLFAFPTITSPTSGIVVGLNPLTSIFYQSPSNRFQGVLNSIPTFKANFKSESEKSFFLPLTLPAASPQKKLFDLSILTPLLFFYKTSHIFWPGFLYSSSSDAINTCISTPIYFAIFQTFVFMS